MIYIKLHQTEKGIIIAMCDEKLVGKVLKKEGGLEIDLDRYSGFYKGDLVKPKDAESMIKDSSFFSASIVGEESLMAFRNVLSVGEESIKKIGDIPFLYVFSMV